MPFFFYFRYVVFSSPFFPRDERPVPPAARGFVVCLVDATPLIFLEARETNFMPWHFLDRSDADSDVLAEYVLALICSDAPDEDIRKASVENLEDFLKESSFYSSISSFVGWPQTLIISNY